MMTKTILVVMFTVTAVLAVTPLWAKSKVKRPSTFNYQRALEAYTNQDFDEAMSYFLKEVQENKNNGYAHSWIAKIHLQNEEYGKALNAANESLKFIPKKDKEFFCEAHGVRADIFLAMKDTMRALNDMDTALKTYPTYEDLIEKRANTYWSLGKYEESNNDYLQLISLDETNPMGHMGYGRNLMEEEKWNEATEQFSYVTKMYSDYSSGFSFLAQCHIGTKNWKDAADNIVTALSIDQNSKAFILMQIPDKTFSTLMIAKLQAQQNNEPGEFSWSYNIAIIYENQKEYNKAIDLYKKAYDQNPNSMIAERISNCYSSMGDQKKALEYIDIAYSLDSSDYSLIPQKADILYYSGNVNGAISQLDEYVKRYPDFYGGYYRRGFYKDNAGLVDDAIADYTMAITLDETYYYAYLGRADQYMKKGLTPKALEDYQKVIELDTIPSSNSCAFYAFLALGEKEKGISYLERCLNEFPDNEGKFYDACCFYSRMEDVDKALDYLKKCLEKGYRKFAHFEFDDDLDVIRNLPEYHAIIKEYEEKCLKNSDETHEQAEEEIITTEKITEIPFIKEHSNTCVVKCTVNELPLNFIFDTGASDVSLSQVEATFMMKNGYLTKRDIIGKHYYADANGNINEGTLVNLRSVNFGGIELNNVKASVVKNQRAPLLLGQSVFQKIGKIEIDNEKRVLKLTK